MRKNSQKKQPINDLLAKHYYFIMAVSLSIIGQIPFFSGLSKLELDRLANAAQIAAFKGGTVISPAHEPLRMASLVLQGQLKVAEYDANDALVRMHLLYPSQIVGYEFLTQSQAPKLAIHAHLDSSLLLMPIHVLQQLVFSSPNFSQKILNLFGESLARASQERLMLSLPNAFHRIFFQLHLLTQPPFVNQMETPASSPKYIPRQEDLAKLTNTSRETVSRAIQYLAKHKVLMKEGHKIKILDSALLQQLAQQGPSARCVDQFGLII